MTSESPVTGARLLLNFTLIAALTGIGVNFTFDNSIDYWIHDSAVVRQERKQWKYVAVVAMDEKIPVDVTNVQALPLFALATERLVAAGAKSVFLDARVSKELEGRMPYATCIELNGEVRWSMPECTLISGNQCQVLSSVAGKAPLKMTTQAISQFSMAPFPVGQKNLPDFLLFDFDAAALITGQDVTASDRLVTRDSSTARWIDLNAGHAVLRIAQSVAPKLLRTSLAYSDPT